jgi:hypothetical protein
MAKRLFQQASWSPAATADTTALITANFMSLGAANATQLLKVIEIYLGGQASASTIEIMQFARDSTLVASATALAAPNSDGPMSTFTGPLSTVPIAAIAGGTLPQRSALTTAARLCLNFNSFGGIVRWVAAPGEEWDIYGISVSVSESSLSNYTGGGTGQIGAHIVYEPW